MCLFSFLLLAALGQIMLYVDGMNGVIGHPETIQWLYTLVGSKVKICMQTKSCTHVLLTAQDL